MYSVVDFARGRKRTVVPDTWLSVNETLCLLPPGATDSDVDVMARNGAEPGQGWMMLEVSSLETFDSFSEAKKQLEKFKDASHSRARSSLRKRKRSSHLEDFSTHYSDEDRKPYAVYGMDFYEEDMSENELISSPESTPRTENVPTIRRTIHRDYRSRNHRFSNSEISSRRDNVDVECDCQSLCHKNFLQALHNMQEQLNKTNQMVEKRTNQMMQQMNRTCEMVQQLLGGHQKQTHLELKKIVQPQPVNQTNGQEEMNTFSQDVECVLQNLGTSAAAQKVTEDTTPNSASNDVYITEDQPSSSTAEVLEMEFKQSLRNRMKLRLKEFENDDIENALTTLEFLGVRNEDHLKYVKSSDLLDALNEVQARILFDFFQAYSESGAHNSSELESQHPSLRHETKLPEADKDCIINISWGKMSPELLADLESSREPQKSDYREMVRIIADDIVGCTISASRGLIKSVAEYCVKKYPILKDKFEDVVLGTGFDTLAYKLACRVDNLRRNRAMRFKEDRKKGDSQDGKFNKRRLKIGLDSYGCVAWAPNIPDKATLENLKKNKRRLLELELSKDHEMISVLMKETYPLQRKEINDGADVETLLSEWPFLFKMQGMLDHFKTLTGMDIRQRTKSFMSEKCKNIFAFFHSRDKVRVKAFITDNDTSRNKLILLFTAVALYFDEEPSECIRTSEVPNPCENPKDNPSHPCLIGKGASALKANEFKICIGKLVVNDGIEDADCAIMMLFASYYVFNLPYPRSIALTLEFFQRCLIGINPSTGAKYTRPGKAYHIHPRLLKVVNKLKIFEDWLSIPTKS